MPDVFVRCPQCEIKLRIPPSGSGGSFRCPRCEKVLRLADSPNTAPPSELATASDSPSAEARAPTAVARSSQVTDPLRHPQSFAAAASSKRQSDALPLKPFLIRWLMIAGPTLVVLSLIGVGGLFAEPVAIAATALCLVATLGCLLTGNVWMALSAGKQSPLLGVAAFIVPLVGIVLAVVNKGSGLRGLIVYLTSFAPIGLALLLLLCYSPLYGSGRRAATRTRANIDRQQQMLQLIHRNEQTVPSDAVVTTARYRMYAPGFEATQVQAESEAVLSQCGNYVPASLRVDPASRTISFRFRGPESLGHQYRTLLAMTNKAALMPVSPELPANARPPQ